MDILNKKPMKMTLKDFNNIDKSSYVGYYWFSNKEKPELVNFKNLEENEIPFVIEGYLYNETEKISISIRNFNGKYVITQFVLSDYGKDNKKFKLLDEKSFPAYKLDGIKEIIFRELQQKAKDDLDFFTYEKVVEIFVGFEYNNQ